MRLAAYKILVDGKIGQIDPNSTEKRAQGPWNTNETNMELSDDSEAERSKCGDTEEHDTEDIDADMAAFF